MRKKSLPIKCFSLLLALLFGFHAAAQESMEFSGTDTLSSDYKTKYTFLPFAAYSPDTRLMFGGFTIKQFKPQKAGKETRPSNIQLTATYTLNNQINLSTIYSILFPDERWIWKGEIGYKKFPKNYWGIGPKTTEEDKLKVNFQNLKLRQSILRRIAENIYLGPQFHFGHQYDVNFKNTDDIEVDPPSVTGAEGSTIAGLGMAFNWDKRDNLLTPTKNHYIELSALFYSTFLLSEYGYQSYQIDARKYFSLNTSGKEVLALQTKMIFTAGDVPFEELGWIGGEVIMRGYFEGRFRDKQSIQTQAEYRRIISGRFGLVAFGAVSNVMPTLNDLKLDNTKWALGTGLRYNINKSDPTYIRIDYGFGKNTSGLYVTFGEAF